LKELGWLEGKNLVYEHRYGESADQLKAAAAELVRLKVDVLLADSCGLAKILRDQTSTIPIVVGGCGFDMVTFGLAASLARPGGNVTGVQIFSSDLIGKRIQLLKELLPSLSRVATLFENLALPGVSPTSRDSYNVAADVAARTVGINRDSFVVGSPDDFPTVFRGMREKGDQALLLFNTPFMTANRRQILDLAATHRIAAMYEQKVWVEAGGLMSYGPNMSAVARRSAVYVMSRQAAQYVDKILKGAKPGDLPVEQPTTFELMINLKTAKALVLTIPPSLLARAEQVIE
jgi:putative ABC transport system substrate-binding protein